MSIAQRYNLILADPAWRQSRGGKKSVRPKSSGVEIGYTVISLEEIESIMRKADALSEPDSVMFLWTIEKYLFEAQQIGESLGYKLHSRMIWNKVTGIPAAFTIRFGHEYLLYMYKGKLIPVAKDERGKIHSVFTEQVKNHSQKPEISYQIIQRLYPDTKKIELFARKKRDGWDCLGLDIDGMRLEESLDLLSDKNNSNEKAA